MDKIIEKKILHITFSLSLSGGPKVILNIIDNVVNFEHFILGVCTNKSYYASVFNEKYGEKFIPVSRLNVLKNIYIFYLFFRKNRIDIVNFHGRGSIIFLPLVKLFCPNTKLIYTVHGFNIESLSLFVKYVYVFIERFCGKIWEVIIFVSESEKDYYLSVLGTITPTYYIVPNFVNVPKNKGVLTSNTPFSDYSPIVNEIKLLFVGRIEFYKGIDIIVESLKLIYSKGVPNFSIFFCGTGKQEKYLKVNIKDLSCNNLFFLGEVPNVVDYMPLFDALLFPSKFEGCPNTVLEALSHKLPVIATPARGVKDLINSTNGYISDDLSPKKYAEQIEIFLSDYVFNYNQINLKKENGYKFFLDNFTAANFTKKMDYIYNRV